MAFTRLKQETFCKKCGEIILIDSTIPKNTLLVYFSCPACGESTNELLLTIPYAKIHRLKKVTVIQTKELPDIYQPI